MYGEAEREISRKAVKRGAAIYVLVGDPFAQLVPAWEGIHGRSPRFSSIIDRRDVKVPLYTVHNCAKISNEMFYESPIMTAVPRKKCPRR